MQNFKDFQEIGTEDAMNTIAELQNELTVIQAKLIETLDYLMKKTNYNADNELAPKLVLIEGGVKIILPEYPPRLLVNDRTIIDDDGKKIVNPAYKLARERWYKLIYNAVREYDLRISPCIVYIIYYVPRVCDIDNFTVKFIIDGLKHSYVINDDNFYNVNAIIQRAIIDKINPRTEIFVIKSTDKNKTILEEIVGQN